MKVKEFIEMNKSVFDPYKFCIHAQKNGSWLEKDTVFSADFPSDICVSLFGDLEVMKVRPNVVEYGYMEMLINFPVKEAKEK